MTNKNRTKPRKESGFPRTLGKVFFERPEEK
jgi:hypothetical protein